MALQPKLRSRKLVDTLRGCLDPFWVSGLAVFCVLLVVGGLWGAGVSPQEPQRESYEWVAYLTLGTIFPVLLLAFSLPTRFSGFAPTLAQTLKLAFAALFVGVCVVFVVMHHQYYALVAAAGHLLLVHAFRRAEVMSGPVSVAISVFVVVVSWTAAAQFLWWSPFDSLSILNETWYFGSTFDAWFSDSTFDAWFLDWRYRIFVFFLALVFVFVNLYPRRREEASEHTLRFRLGSLLPNIAAVLVFALASVRSDQLFNLISYHNWSVYVGPAEMVRQGGWLLWDVPAQYGFLSTLAIAFLPAGSVWQSLYVANSLLLFFSAIFLFFVLRSLGSGFLNFCFSFAVTLAVVFLMSGWAPELLGPQIAPSVSAYRFFWVYPLLAILIWEFRSGAEEPPGRILLAGCAVWLVGTLWSAESAVYSAAVWLPAYTLLVLRKAASVRAESGSLKRSLLTALLWLLIPPVSLFLAVGTISAYYVARLGHLPDWFAFLEYSVSFSSGFNPLPIDLGGPVLTLFLVFCGLSAVAVHFLRGGLTHRALGLIAGTWGALWVTSSYFVPRSYPEIISSLSPILCVAIGLALYLLAYYRKTEGWAMLVRTSFVPVLVVILTATFGNAAGLVRYVSSSPHTSRIEQETNRSFPAEITRAAEFPEVTDASGVSRHAGYEPEINSRLPVIDESLRALLDEAQVESDDPIVYINPSEIIGILPARPVSNGGETHFFSPPRTWLPTMPFVLLAPLPDERKELYMSRFTERARLSGWLIQSKKEAPYTSSPWFSGQLGRTHTPTEVFENDDWRLTWFEFSPDDAEGT